MKKLLLLFLLSPAALSASLFSQEAPINIVLTGALSNHFEHRELEQRRFESVQISLDGQALYGLMKVRGNARATQCDIPPFKLKFSEKNPYFKKNKAYKIVSHCNDKEKTESRNSIGSEVPIAGDNYLLKEYLSYKIQNLIMPNRFQARLLKISYVDENKQIPEMTRYAFALERPKRLAKSLDAKYLGGLKIVDPETLLLDELVWSSYFNLLIGNQDYTLWAKTSHNFKFFKKPEGIIAVPYDFNLSELMNREEDAEESYYDMYTHNTQFPCVKSDEQTFRRIAKALYSEKEKIFKYLAGVAEIEDQTRHQIQSLLETKFSQLQELVVNENATFNKEPISWSPGFCRIAFELGEPDVDAS